MGAAGSQLLGRLGGPRRAALPGAAWLGAAALGLGAAALGTVLWRRRARRPRRRQQVGTVAELWIFPVKSCKGVAVREAEGTALGLRCGRLRDRFWLVINEAGTMVTARQEPRLVLVSLTCEGDTLTLSAAYMQDLLLPVEAPATNPVLKCRVHGLEIQGRDCGEAAAQWITSFLKAQPYRLVHFEPHMPPRKSHQIMDAFRPTDQIAYSDASPLLLLSEASLADLNSKLERKVKATNFRPNILVSGCGEYAEDSWHKLLVGDVELRRAMACSRCLLTTVDPDTGIMSRKEPLETLKRHVLSWEASPMALPPDGATHGGHGDSRGQRAACGSRAAVCRPLVMVTDMRIRRRGVWEKEGDEGCGSISSTGTVAWRKDAGCGHCLHFCGVRTGGRCSG
ncbi:mitochondrial amidoxime-reducing component 1 isoform X3 [Pipistrellus kuhlii]|uniref:mitochondrial amidoxime-reducing component 1 isoform X3 n=1 Tax=Pipistrellus kuhlii TaxID=59472 RepID=UPI001E270E2A|nr:mitochondrial amidoxime-reducing component 1 isoform X3 [Pipistrellus kuhlii]